VIAVFGSNYAQSRRGNKGNASVEFALVLPLVLTLLFGIVEFGLIFKDQLSIQQAAREGARVAAVGQTIENIDARVTAAATNITAANLTYTVQYRTLSAGVWSSWANIADKTDGSGTNNAPQGSQVSVHCTYTHTLVTGPLFASIMGQKGATSITLYSQMIF
jgi:Flp pilus assembly protein TadG